MPGSFFMIVTKFNSFSSSIYYEIEQIKKPAETEENSSFLESFYFVLVYNMTFNTRPYHNEASSLESLASLIFFHRVVFEASSYKALFLPNKSCFNSIDFN